MFRLSTLGVMFVTIGPMLATLGCSPLREDMTSFVAVAGTYSLMEADAAGGDSSVCKNCGGTGRVGDGTIFVPCPVCQGDSE